MKHLFNEILHHLNHDKNCVLVSIVGDQGSAPRTAGARMLVNEQGRVCGTIGGGAVEFRAEQMARELISEKKSLLHHFRLNKADTDELHMVCGGNVDVLFRFIDAAEPAWHSLTDQVLAGCAGGPRLWLVDDLTQLERLPWLTTAAQAQGLPAQFSTVLGGELPLKLNDADHSYYAEPLPQGERVIIFGGGHITQELVPLLAHVDFRVLVYEDRPEYADLDHLPGAEASLIGDYQRISDVLTLQPDDYIVIMTHGHSHDYDVQRQVMAAPYAYLGVIGSRAKTLILNKHLLEDGFTQDQLEQVHTPIGISIKAQTPAEIAVSIAGELILARAERRNTGSGSCPV